MRRRDPHDRPAAPPRARARVAGRDARYIENQVSSGVARERPVDPLYGKGMISGGRWLQEAETGEVWRLVPAPPFRMSARADGVR
jgi:hypothetical protein